MRIPRPIQNLIEAFERLPGIGPKTAARLTFYLLHVPQSELEKFSSAISRVKKDTVICSRCSNIAETNPCSICQDPSRDESIICVIEQSLDLIALEKTGKYKGLYHVLGGVIDPLNNIGPEEIRIGELLTRLRLTKTDEKVKEIILAMNPTMEGEATAMYIARELRAKNGERKTNMKITRIARGLPTGSDLEYADEVTLERALEGRREY